MTSSTTSPSSGPGDGPARPLPPDQADRDRILDRLGETLFVEAGAGSGKTRALVERIVRLVTSGTAGLDAIAAITFTEKAAAELRDRVRQELEVTRARVEAEGVAVPAVKWE